MNIEALYLNKKLIVSNEEGRITKVEQYKDNSFEKLVVENKIDELRNDIEDLKEKKNNLEKELLVNKSTTPLIYSLLTPLIVGGALSLIPEFSKNIQIPNVDKEINNIVSIILASYAISLPVGITFSSLIRLDNKKKREILQEIKDEIESKKIQIYDQKEIIEELELDDLVTDGDFNDYDLIDVKNQRVLENYKRVLKK